MPGIYGFSVSKKNDANNLEKMSEAMTLYPYFIQDAGFKSDELAASRVHLGHIGETHTPSSHKGIHVWIEGETYNLKEVCQALNLTSNTSLSKAMIKAYIANQLDAFLNKLDADFCAVLYDQNKKILKLISDRYGVKMLYWYFHNNQIVWSSEVKGILALESIDTTIDSDSFDCFMDLGYLMGEHTWFEHIRLIKPATIIDFDLIRQDMKEHCYWKWSEIKPCNMTFDDAVDELGKRFINAVDRRFDPKEKMGIPLSGGLDSRAIFAAVDHIYPGYKGHTYTFGIPNCDDITIAKQVAVLSNYQQKIYYFNDQNWFTPRIERIWNTDGMFDMMHMHGSEFIDDIAQNIQVNLSGYLGDAILGGGFLEKKSLNTRATKENTKAIYGKYSNLGQIESDFYEIDHIEPHLYMNRVRRFTNMGGINNLIKTDQRKPFLDNAIVELVFSLPDEYRQYNRLYSAMLRKYFPQYFNDIPWQKTGKPVAQLKWFHKLVQVACKLRDGILGVKSKKSYTDYSDWIRMPNVAEYLERLLEKDSSCYSEFTSIDLKEQYLLPHLGSNKIDNSNEILRAATIEIYLRKVKVFNLP